MKTCKKCKFKFFAEELRRGYCIDCLARLYDKLSAKLLKKVWK